MFAQNYFLIFYIKNINVNDNDNYYVIDIENIDNLTLNYGLDYKNYETNNNIEDVYVINEKSHTIYYIKGIEIDGSRYYTTNANYTEVIVPKWSNVYNNTEEFIDLNGDKATIPAGFQISLQQGENTILDGLVIRNATDLNEFVWIPCSLENYHKINWKSYFSQSVANARWDRETRRLRNNANKKIWRILYRKI